MTTIANVYSSVYNITSLINTVRLSKMIFQGISGGKYFFAYVTFECFRLENMIQAIVSSGAAQGVVNFSAAQALRPFRIGDESELTCKKQRQMGKVNP